MIENVALTPSPQKLLAHASIAQEINCMHLCLSCWDCWNVSLKVCYRRGAMSARLKAQKKRTKKKKLGRPACSLESLPCLSLIVRAPLTPNTDFLSMQARGPSHFFPQFKICFSLLKKFQHKQARFSRGTFNLTESGFIESFCQHS